MVAELAEMAENKNITSAQLALAWILKQSENIIPIPGTKRIKYLNENIEAVNVDLSKEDVENIENLLRKYPIIGDDNNEFDSNLIIENFPLYLLSGQVIFNFFSDATNNSMGAIIMNGSLIKKVYVPKYLFVLSRVISSFINLMASFTALILVMLAMRVELHWTSLMAFIPLALLVAFSLGVGLILAAIVVQFRDIMHLYSVFITALMYMTPVIYPMSILPHWMKIVVYMNPITNYLVMFRNVMLNNRILSLWELALGVVEAVIALIIGLVVFYKKQDSFILNI